MGSPSVIPPPPAGYTLDSIPPPPAGYTLDSSTPAPPPTAQVSAQPSSQHPIVDWLKNLDSDMTQGGNRTLPGHILGYMQGHGDTGYSGLNSGVAAPVAQFMGSPVLGPIHAAQGVAETPQHPILGPLRAIGGALQTVAIPSAMVDPEISPVANLLDKIPSKTTAGNLFESLNTDLANQPVKLNAAVAPLQRAVEIGGRGSTLPKAVSDLLARSESPLGTDMSFPEARDYQSALSDLSASDKMAMNGRMRGAVAQLQKGLYGDIHGAADSVGRGQDYADAMKQYAQAAKLQAIAKTAGKLTVGAAGLGEGYHVVKSLMGSK